MQIEVGTKVETITKIAGDYDFGRVLDIEGGEALVAFENGACKMWVALSDIEAM